MKEIRNEKFIYFEGNKAVVRADIQTDTVDELPEISDFSGRILAMGSVAWVIGTGDFYGLNSSGAWVNQTTGEEVSVSTIQTSSTSPITSELSEITLDKTNDEGDKNDGFIQSSESE